MLRIEHLTKVYRDGTRALDDVSLTVREGEAACLVGGNGAGKTTMIHMLFGFLRPTAGGAFVNGHSVHDEPAAARRNLAYLSEDVVLYDDLTAVENLRYFARVGGIDATSRQTRRCLEQTGIGSNDADRLLRAYSKGMRQKVALALCLLRDARAVILDDPTIGLDPSAARDLMDRLREQKQAGRAVLMATHDLFRAREVADTFHFLRQGQLVASLSREQVGERNLEALFEQYIGR